MEKPFGIELQICISKLEYIYKNKMWAEGVEGMRERRVKRKGIRSFEKSLETNKC